MPLINGSITEEILYLALAWDDGNHSARIHEAQRETAALRADLQAAQERIAEQARRLDAARKALHGMIDGWRDHANGHYCRTYNPGMTQGLNCAADALEEFVSGLDTRLAANPAPESQPQNGEGRP